MGEVQAADVVQESDEGEAEGAAGPFDGVNSWFLSRCGEERESVRLWKNYLSYLAWKSHLHCHHIWTIDALLSQLLVFLFF